MPILLFFFFNGGWQTPFNVHYRHLLKWSVTNTALMMVTV